jgi:hypothetical protein
MDGTIFGETLLRFLTYTFTNVRDGDRFYFEIDPVLSEEDKKWIREVTFNRLVLSNTQIKKMQSRVFTQVNFPEICDNMAVEASFNFKNVNDTPISNMGVYFSNRLLNATNENGSFSVKNLSACLEYEFKLATEPAGLITGLSTKDIIIIQHHILGHRKLSSIPAMIAADMDNSATISSLDIILLRKILVGYPTDFSTENMWQYVNASVSGMGKFPGSVKFQESNPYGTTKEYYLIKKGDVDGDWYNSSSGNPSFTSIVIEEKDFIAGQTMELPIQFIEGGHWAGFQFSFSVNADLVDLETIQWANFPEFSDANLKWQKESGVIHVSWNYSGANVPFFDKEKVLFILKFKAKKAGFLHDVLTFAKDGLAPEVYLSDISTGNISLVVLPNLIRDFNTYPPQPNPFIEETTIPYTLNASTFGVIYLFDGTGKLILEERKLMPSGKGDWLISGDRLPHSGIYFYEIRTDSGYKKSGKIWLMQK